MKEYPQGAIIGICSGATLIASLGMGFLGYWDLSHPEPLEFAREWPVILPDIVGIAFLIVVPFLATMRTVDGQPGRHLDWARLLFLAGAFLVFFAPVLAVLLDA